MSCISAFKKNYQRFPQLPQMIKLWHYAYWDGAYSGICKVNGERYYFDMLEEFDDYPEGEEEAYDFKAPWYRRYLIWKLTDEQIKELDRRQERWKALVSSLPQYDAEGKRIIPEVDPTVPKDGVAQYFKEAKTYPKLDLTPAEDQIIGWYEWK